MQVYPEEARRSPAAGLNVIYRDVFDFEDGGGTVVRPLPPPGTFHQYRVRAVDAIGRTSLEWTETNVLRLEKRVPPPVPAGPDVPHAPALPAPQGVQARVLVRSAPDLTPEDRATLGSDDNAIVLAWGWRQEQRDQDAFAREFRVYLAEKPLDSVVGEVTDVLPVSPGIYDVSLSLQRSVEADAARHLQLRAGYPFFIAGHSAGSVITVRVEARVPDGSGDLPQPALGPVQLPLRPAPSLGRPPAWSERVGTQAITAATTYQAVLRSRLTLSAERPRDAIWVGVSAADDQDYVEDQLAPAETRPGNESAIVSVLCQARFYGHPDFEVPPALNPVPVLVSPEPAGRPIFFDMDLRPGLVGSGLDAQILSARSACPPTASPLPTFCRPPAPSWPALCSPAMARQTSRSASLTLPTGRR